MGSFYTEFLEAVERWPGAVSLEVQRSAGRERYTYAQIRRMAEAVAARLMENGIARGDRCALLAGNGPRWVATFLGVLAAGGVVVPLDTSFAAGQIAILLRASGSAVLLTDARQLPNARCAVEGMEVGLALLERVQGSGVTDLETAFVADTGQRPGATAASVGLDHFTPVEVDAGELAAISYTSGTTSDPKGVMLTHANMRAQTQAILRVFDIGPRDSILGILPLFHVLALMTNLMLPMASGARVLFLETLNTTELVRALPDVNIFACVPQFFYLIHERIWKQVSKRGLPAWIAFRLMLRVAGAGRKLRLNLGKVFFRPVHKLIGPKRYLATGGSRFDPQIGHDFEALGFTMLQGYGLTETSGAATYTPPRAVNIASVGRALPGVEVKIIPPTAAGSPGEDWPPVENGHAVGEVAIRGPIVMKGYYERPEATAEALRDGWLYTGDLGYLDETGNLFLTGRAKDVIVLSSGKNIYPEDIEEHYAKHPFIQELCVLGLDGVQGERLHAVIVPKFELLREMKIVNLREALRFQLESLSAQLPATKRILSYEIWAEELPRTSTRKLKRFEIERRVRANGRSLDSDRACDAPTPDEKPAPRFAIGTTQEEQAWLAMPEVQRALAVIRETVKPARQVRPGDNLELDLGLDSLQRIELLVALERELGAKVEESVVAEVYTVKELVDAVRAHSATLPPGRADHRPALPDSIAWEAILEHDAPSAETLDVMTRRPLREACCYLFFRWLDLFSREALGIKFMGVENLPKQGPVIICPNHQSFIDPMAVLTQLSWTLFRNMFSVGTTEVFGVGLARRMGLWIRVIPVDPDASLISGMRAAAYGLRRGKVLILYPEGERSIDGTPKIFHKGAAILATHLNVPICPVAMDGFFEVWPRGKRFRGVNQLRGAQVRFGELIYPPAGGSPEQKYEQLTAELRARVFGMWEELRRSRHG